MPRTLGDLLQTGTIRPRLRPGQFDLRSVVHGIRGITSSESSNTTSRRAAVRRGGIRAFCEIYLKHHFYHGFGEHHLDMFAAIDAPPPEHRGKRVARIEPRKFGKTTVISLATPLYCLALQKKKFILLVGESSANAGANLQSIVQEIEGNQLLQEDFPHLKPHRDLKGQMTKWNDSGIMLSDGALVLVKGMAARMRGMKQSQYRPDLGIVDDPESPETASSFVTRQRHKHWFGGTFLGLGGDDWDVYVIGNLPHHDCLIAELVKSSEWDGKLYRAINIPPRIDERYPIGNTRHDDSPLWPEVWPIARLEEYKKDPTVGDVGFAREMMNDPRDEKDKPFDSHRFTYVDFRFDNLSNYVDLITFIDPAGGEKPNEMILGKKDWAAIVTGGRTRDNFIDILDVRMTRKMPETQIKMLLSVYATFGSRLAAEENMAKNLLGPTIHRLAKEMGLYPQVKEVHQTRNKKQRILAIEPLITCGTVRFARHLRAQCPDYFGQFDDFPGVHEDGPDATEGVIRELEINRVLYAAPVSVTTSSYWKR